MTEKVFKYLSVEQFANFCGVNPQLVLTWIKNGEIMATRPPGKEEYKIAIDNIRRVKFEKVEMNSCLFEANEEVSAKVLIVDDEQNIIESIGPHFSNNGFRILSCTNAYEAMFLLYKERPLVLTLDLRMIDSNGIDVLKMINDQGINQNIWVIIISGASESELQSAVDFGADFYLQKPYNEEDLNKIIKKLSVDLKKKVA